MNKSEAEYLNLQAKEAASDLRSALYMLHHYKGYRHLGYDTWAAYVHGELDQNIRDVYRYLKQARGEEKLQALGHDKMSCFNNALEAVADLAGEIDDITLTTAVQIASDHGQAKLSVPRLQSALTQIDQTIRTGAVELVDGEQRPIVPLLAERVTAEVHEATKRDTCRWVVSRATAAIYNAYNNGFYLSADLRIYSAIMNQLRDLEGQQVVISIGIEDEINA